MKLILGPMTVGIYVGCYARTGKWPDILYAQLKGVPVPEQLQKLGNEARVEEQRLQAIRDQRPSGLLPEEEEIAVPEALEVREVKRWAPNMDGVCRYCGQHHVGDVCGIVASDSLSTSSKGS